METIFGLLSAVIIFSSYPIYAIRVWQRKIIPNIASWSIFVLISLAIFLSYASSGAKENSWATYGPLIGCTVILIITLFRSKEKSLNHFDIACLVFGSFSLVVWYFTKDTKEMAQYALYTALFADFLGMLPSIKFLSKHPKKDRPFMWIIFGFGYFLTFFAITDHTFANWALPVFMVIIPAFVWVPLVKYRIKNKIPFKEWI